MDWNEAYNFYCAEAKRFLQTRDLMSSNSTIEALAAQWSLHLNSFNAANSQEFYKSWKGNRGASNIAANIQDQFNRRYLQYNLMQYPKEFNGRVLDFGCGTASITLMWQKYYVPNCVVYLADIDNLAREYTRWYANEHKDTEVRFINVSLEEVSEGFFDTIICMHVLEHLVEPSKAFRLLDSKVKANGILFLEAPWGGHLEHLESATQEWIIAGGEQLLSSSYEYIKSLDTAVIASKKLSGIYKKKAGSRT
jgi:2-polyprenyl-3-methyl-5-hydroxy-6-metoxy-1,4-benzoquinol methylase